MRIIQKYWLGYYPLAISFWIFFITLGIVFNLISFVLLEQGFDTKSNHMGAIMVYHLTGGLVLFPWQAIGLLRSAERHYSECRRPVTLYSVQAVILISITLLASHFVGLAQTLSIAHSFEEFKSKTNPPQYRIKITDNKKQLVIKGTLDFGITEAVSLLLKKHPGVKRVILESEGGQIYEGRGLAVLFNQHALDTYSNSYCLSSCTTAFIGGIKRYLAEDAKLGFHQYSLEPKNLQAFQGFYNLDAEQDKDMEIYRSKNIEESFIQKIFHKPKHEFWYPSLEILLKAGVVTKVIY